MDEQLDDILKNRIKEVFENFEDPSADEGWLLLREKYPEQERIIMTAYSETIEIKEAIKMGHAFRSLAKPWDNEELIDAIKLGYESYIWKITRKKMMDDLTNDCK